MIASRVVGLVICALGFSASVTTFRSNRQQVPILPNSTKRQVTGSRWLERMPQNQTNQLSHRKKRNGEVAAYLYSNKQREKRDSDADSRPAADQARQSTQTNVTQDTSEQENNAPEAPVEPQKGPIRYYTLNIVGVNLYTYCNPFADAVAINYSSPGPTLRARRGERLIVKVINGMADRNTTIHWHGFSMHLNPASDGTPLLSQWPIAPGKYFEYSIHIPRDWEAAGTYFYHTHVGLQAMSAYGPLIIEDELAPPSNEVIYGGADLEARKGRSYDGVSPYQYDEDRIVMVMDYYGATSPSNITRTLLGSPFVWPGSAHALPINGKAAGSQCNETAVALMNPPSACPTGEEEKHCYGDYAQIDVEYDRTIRFRIIGSQSLMYVAIGIPYHVPRQSRMTLIEADGTYLDEYTADELEIASGQRYSWLIKTKTKEEVLADKAHGLYWIRFESRWRPGPASWARLVYPLGRETYPSASKMPLPPHFSGDNSTHANERILHEETFGWVASGLSPLKDYSEPAPDDSQVTRTVIIDGRQIIYTLPGTESISLRWAQNAQLGIGFQGTYQEEAEYSMPLLVDLLQNAQHIRDMMTRSKSQENEERALCRLIDCDLPGEKERAENHKLRQGFDYDLNVYVAEPGEVIDIVLINRPSEFNNKTEVHPWHLHGPRHWTMGMGSGTFSFAAYEQLLQDPSKFAQPIPRDTSVLYSNNETITDEKQDAAWLVIRQKVRPDFSGIFPLHCHLHFHLTMGMAVIWAMGPEELASAADAIHNSSASGPASDARWQSVLGRRPDGSIEGISSEYLSFGRNVRAVRG